MNTALKQDLLKYQNYLVIERLGEILKFYRDEFERVSSDETSLETIIYDKLPNITIYVDYAVSDKIELEVVNILNSDDEELTTASEVLYHNIKDIIDSINYANKVYSINESEFRREIQFA